MVLRSQVNALFTQSRGSAGSRSIMTMMQDDGIDIGRFKVRRLIQEQGLISKQPGSPAYKQATVERLFRSLKTEWVLALGYATAFETQRDISHFLVHRYNWLRPHQFNEGLPPAVAEKKLNFLSGFS